MPEFLSTALSVYRHSWRQNAGDLLWWNAEGAPVCADNLRHRVLQPPLTRLGIPRAGVHAFGHLQDTLLVATCANPKVAQAQQAPVQL